MLGLELGARSDETAECRMAVRPDLIQETGVVQGGILSALADATAVYLCMPGLPDGDSLTSIEFKINFLRPGLPDGGPLVARAEAIRSGRRVKVCRSVVEQDGRALADALLTYLVVPASS